MLYVPLCFGRKRAAVSAPACFLAAVSRKTSRFPLIKSALLTQAKPFNMAKAPPSISTSICFPQIGMDGGQPASGNQRNEWWAGGVQSINLASVSWIATVAVRLSGGSGAPCPSSLCSSSPEGTRPPKGASHSWAGATQVATNNDDLQTSSVWWERDAASLLRFKTTR